MHKHSHSRWHSHAHSFARSFTADDNSLNTWSNTRTHNFPPHSTDFTSTFSVQFNEWFNLCTKLTINVQSSAPKTVFWYFAWKRRRFYDNNFFLCYCCCFCSVFDESDDFNTEIMWFLPIAMLNCGFFIGFYLLQTQQSHPTFITCFILFRWISILINVFFQVHFE